MRRSISIVSALAVSTSLASAEPWKPAAAPLMTEWAAKVDPAAPLPEYPRPQLVRDQWSNLNGLWDYAVVGRDDAQPTKFDGQILVPFCIESALSGVGKRVNPDQSLWYRRTFATPKANAGDRTLIHFGGVDWETTVYVNGQKVAFHQGGHTPFTADVTSALKASGDNELVVKVWDPTDAGSQPRGKQDRTPNGIWYTPVTGIWQTVWTETVPATSIKRLKLTPTEDANGITIEAELSGNGDGVEIEAHIFDGGKEVGGITTPAGGKPRVTLGGAKKWTPDSPFLYDLTVDLKQGGKTVDSVKSYFALRSVSTVKDAAGYPRIALNGKPLFLFGPLDQGWWPDGLYTAPTDEALKWDIEFTKKLGLNMCRKHIKIEPARWYYWCDKLGLAVWQDQSSGSGEHRNQSIGDGKPDASFSPIEKVQFVRELTEMIDTLYNHPSIIAWVPFNEGWGQHDTNDVLKWTKQYDPTRLVDGPSGWTDRGFGDMHDMHNYPGPGMFPTSEDRISVLGEFGGLGLPVQGHLWQGDKNWGYRTFQDTKELNDRYATLIEHLAPLAQRGLAAAVYTQTTDVEGEVNGYATYDRKVIKYDVDRVAKLSRAAIEAASMPVRVSELVPTSRQTPQTYSYTFDKPADGWEKADFGASAWTTGPGGFGTAFTPGSAVKTEWTGDDIWLRRTVKLESKPAGDVMLNIHNDDDVDVFINGVKAYSTPDAKNNYVLVPIAKEAAAALKAGDNVIAIHCHQRGGGQYIDVGLSALVPVK